MSGQMQPVPQEIRDDYADVISQLRAVADVVADLTETMDQLEGRMNDVYGPNVPGEAWDESGAFAAGCWMELVELRAGPQSLGCGDPAEDAAAFGLPEDFVTLANSKAASTDRICGELVDLQRERDRLEGRVFELVTSGIGGEEDVSHP